MNIEILHEAGYNEAILGISLNKHASLERSKEVAKSLAGKDYGHDKFLRMIDIWMLVTAPRFWWVEMDQYKIGKDENDELVFFEGDVITSSESTMNSIAERDFNHDDFEYPISQEELANLNHKLNGYRLKHITLAQLKNSLPEGYLQKRVIKMNYAVAWSIKISRQNHRLPQWHTFIDALRNLKHSELIFK